MDESEPNQILSRHWSPKGRAQAHSTLQGGAHVNLPVNAVIGMGNYRGKLIN
jgi:hypothetical protein